MKKIILVSLVMLLLGGGGFYLYINSGEVLNEALPTDQLKSSTNNESAGNQIAISEQTDNIATIKPTVSGTFTEIDLVHKGSGMAQIFDNIGSNPILRLQDFQVTRGPDLYVYLSKNTDIKNNGIGEWVSLGVLKSSKGNQNYELPENYKEYRSVVIWCQAFGVLFSEATLK